MNVNMWMELESRVCHVGKPERWGRIKRRLMCKGVCTMCYYTRQAGLTFRSLFPHVTSRSLSAEPQRHVFTAVTTTRAHSSFMS